MKRSAIFTWLTLALGLGNAASALAADTYYIRVPAASLCSGAHCTLQPRVLPSQAGGTPAAGNPSSGGSTPTPPQEPQGSPTIDVSMSSLTFASALKGYTSPAQTFQVRNTGTAALTFSGISLVSGQADYGQSNNCGTSLPVGGSCDVAVTFSPSARGTRQGNLAIVTNDRLATVSLSGAGLEASGTLTPTAYDFGTDMPGVVSIIQGTFFNSGDMPLQTYMPVPAGLTMGAARFNTCGTAAAPKQLPVNGSCSFRVNYSRTQEGTLSTPVVMMDLTYGQVASVTLTGKSEQIKGALSNTSPYFGDVTQGTTSTVIPVILSNQSTTTAMTISGIGVSTGAANFAQNNNCGTSLAPGAYCTINISFTPSVTGALSGQVNVITDQKTLSVYPAGNGVAAPKLVVDNNVSSLVFKDVPVGATSAAKTVVLRNTGTDAVTISSITTTYAGFVQTNNCGSSLAPGATCSIDVTFSMGYVGSLNASGLNIASSDRAVFVQLQGNTVDVLGMPTTDMVFGEVPVYTTVTKQFTIQNTGTQSPLTVTGVTIANSSDYTQTNNCSTLAPGASCTVSVSFRPTHDFNNNGYVQVATTGGTKYFYATGIGTHPLTFSASELRFPSTKVGSSSTLPFTITNTSNYPVEMAGYIKVNSQTSPMSQTNTCGAQLAANSSCVVTVKYTPTSVYNGSGVLDSLWISATFTNAYIYLYGTSY